VVLVVVDQLRGDYLERWQDHFGHGGFYRLLKDGAWFDNCHYPYATTTTAPGHASVVTGCSPNKHGIVMNEWFDRAAGATISCVGSDRYARVPPLPPDAKTGGASKKLGGASPEHLLVPTVGEVLKEATGGKGRIVALSLKDRSAILLGGRRADLCYWLDPADGTFVTSSYFQERVCPWVEAFNQEAGRDRWFARDWVRLRSDLDYARYSGPDEVPGEGTGIAQGRTFPHPMTGGDAKPGKRYYAALYNSPFGNELLLDLTLKAIEAEHLGAGPAPDLLCVSFSSSDAVGHCWGPDSQEVLDVTLRMDDLLHRLLDRLDRAVGKGRYGLVLTADHGVCPLPEVSRAQGREAERIPPALLSQQATTFLQATFGKEGDKARWVEAADYPWIYLNQRLLQQRGLTSTRVEQALAGWLTQQPGVLAAFTRSQLQVGGQQDGSPLAAAVQRSFQPDRCGDLAVVLKPYYLIWNTLTGTTHGTPHDYDTHVPLVIFGPGVLPGQRREPITPQASAAMLAGLLGIEPPAQAEAPLPRGLISQEMRPHEGK
jgi:predicted AlkP superfamily pyrophosphatase or phosphodiesterase